MDYEIEKKIGALGAVLTLMLTPANIVQSIDAINFGNNVGIQIAMIYSPETVERYMIANHITDLPSAFVYFEGQSLAQSADIYTHLQAENEKRRKRLEEAIQMDMSLLYIGATAPPPDRNPNLRYTYEDLSSLYPTGYYVASMEVDPNSEYIADFSDYPEAIQQIILRNMDKPYDQWDITPEEWDEMLQASRS